ncbi:MAG: magnesium transporter [Lachnospiraceae bacterium]
MEQNNEKEVWKDSEIIPERPDYEKELEAIIKSNASNEIIKKKLEDYHENDIADVLEDLTLTERKRLYRILGKETVSEVFTYLEDVKRYIEELDSELAADIIESMDADDAVDVLAELEEEKSQELFQLMDEDSRRDITLIHSYAEDEIGSKMTTNFIVIRRGIGVRQAMKVLIEQAAENDNIGTVYVEETDGSFYGAIDLKDLIIAREYMVLENLISTSYPYVYAGETIEKCIDELKDYSEDSIPVLDNNNHLLGVITAQDIVEVVDEEMGEDYAMLGGLTAEEDLHEPVIESIKKRIPWLIVLLFLGLGVSSVVGMFENVVAELTLVMCFQSLILDMSGNVGTQSLAVTIRVLMDENLSFRQKLQLVFKEMRVGFFNGLLLGILALLCIGAYIWLIKGKTVLFAFSTSACIGAALMVAMMISGFTGTIIPIIFKKLNIDPAVASGPLITTINDLVAVVVYYGLAWVVLIDILHLNMM